MSKNPIDTAIFRLGLDIGSTTAKLVLVSPKGFATNTDYRRHKGDIPGTIQDMLDTLQQHVGDIHVSPVFTGSAGMGMAERTGVPFVQEVVAASKAVMERHPQCRMLIDVGGEDSKMIFFNRNCRPDMRMNGNCAGGTGAFIDQMASLLNVSIQTLDELAQKAGHCHPIASRCGVFAKTDIQNLINTGVSKSEIAFSIFQAVAVQVVNSLARGHDMNPPVIFIGGPLSYYRSLRHSFLKVLSMGEDDTLLPDMARVYPAYGSALTLDTNACEIIRLHAFSRELREKGADIAGFSQHEVLFSDRGERVLWEQDKARHSTPAAPLQSAAGKDVFIGIDAGSTTTKVVATDAGDAVLFRHYDNNRGNPVKSVIKGLNALNQAVEEAGIRVRIRECAVTGYGEELIRAALNIDLGIVETLAHYYGARAFDPMVTFILDIGGQDMKAIFVEDGVIKNIEINEACSSGCGSFIETFADSLGYSPAQFGELACTSAHPVDLGSRCTVFMNSSVKQALRQGSNVSDLAAGLSYSVIRNCLHKVLRISDAGELGDRIVVQGGTFKNPGVLRAFEKLLGKSVVRPDISEYMGAYGAAIKARKSAEKTGRKKALDLLQNLDSDLDVQKKQILCKGCANHCKVQMICFPNGCRYYTGNRCEQKFSNSGQAVRPGANLFNTRRQLLQNPAPLPVNSGALTVGIPMALNFFESYPFWAAFFYELGFQVIPSCPRDGDLGIGRAATIMSDNICYPAKLVHAHIFDLISRKVDRIFFPHVVLETPRFNDEANCFNCPVVTGYPDIISSAINPGRYGIALDSPVINFSDTRLLKKACRQYALGLSSDISGFNHAFDKALQSMARFKEDLQQAGKSIIKKARANRERIVVLAGRPYHTDPAIHHAIPDLISRMGIHVLTEDALPLEGVDLPEPLEVADQWEYSNRLYRAAHWAGQEPGAEFMQFNSFGCGPDAVVIDEVKVILNTYGKAPVVLKIDEVTSIGSAKLRIRSLIETRSNTILPVSRYDRSKLPAFKKKDRRRKILIPNFSPVYSFFAQSAFAPMGYEVETLPPPDQDSVKLGLKYVNNDMCYPAIVTIGDIIKGLNSGRYDPDTTAVALTETGGQCRATNYTSLLKKALLQAGHDNVPVVSASFSRQSANDQPGFSINRPKVISLILSGLLVVDQLIRMYHATAVREKTMGDSLDVLKRHLERARSNAGPWMVKDSHDVLEKAVRDFNQIRTCSDIFPRAGLVGEIYVKYNPFASGNIAEQLMKEGIQVSIPALITFFLQTFVNVPFNHFNHIQPRRRMGRQLMSFVQRFADAKIRRANKCLSGFRHSLEPIPTAFELAACAQRVVNLSNQAGEGWLLPGEVVNMAEAGIRNIISLQPFGCIANHIVAKGVSKKFIDLFPDLNFLALDMDAGNSDVNIQNRLSFFIHSTRLPTREKSPVRKDRKG